MLTECSRNPKIGLNIEPMGHFMHVENESFITGQVAKQLRLAHNLSQKEFWGRVGKSQSNGTHYENGRAIIKPVRILIFANYVLGLKLDMTTPEGIARGKSMLEAQRLHDAQQDLEKARAAAEEKAQQVKAAAKRVKRAA